MGRRWSPPGGFNPPPTEGVQGVLDHHHQPQHQTQDTNIEWPIQKCLMRFSCFPSLYPSPGRSRTPQTRRQKAEKFAGAAYRSAKSVPSKIASKKCQKNIEKTAKIEDLGLPKPSPNPPKKPSKSKVQKNSVFSCIFHINSTYFLPRFS